jgi:hypothetical protein
VSTFQQRVDAIIQLGQVLANWPQKRTNLFHQAYIHNNWFTHDNVANACASWAAQLTTENMAKFVSAYDWPDTSQQTTAVIAAGNIPLVGLHDVLCVLLSGQKLLLKTSQDDTVLIEAVLHELIEILPSLKDSIIISKERLPKDFDKVIATGSNNTNRYFEHYFANKKHLLRGARTSVAVLTGNETDEDMQALANDIFMYFGLGCRNVSKIYIPQQFDFAMLYENAHAYKHVIDHHKYANNYTYHKAIMLLNMAPFLDNGFLLLSEDERMASPLSMLFYEKYNDIQEVEDKLQAKSNQVQCVISKFSQPEWVGLGRAQQPSLFDFADGVDTVAFLLG